jgi:hypothetical protein
VVVFIYFCGSIYQLFLWSLCVVAIIYFCGSIYQLLITIYVLWYSSTSMAVFINCKLQSMYYSIHLLFGSIYQLLTVMYCIYEVEFIYFFDTIFVWWHLSTSRYFPVCVMAFLYFCGSIYKLIIVIYVLWYSSSFLRYFSSAYCNLCMMVFIYCTCGAVFINCKLCCSIHLLWYLSTVICDLCKVALTYFYGSIYQQLIVIYVWWHSHSFCGVYQLIIAINM